MDFYGAMLIVYRCDYVWAYKCSIIRTSHQPKLQKVNNNRGDLIANLISLCSVRGENESDIVEVDLKRLSHLLFASVRVLRLCHS